LSYPIHISPNTTFALYRLPDAKDHFLVQQRNGSYSPLTQTSFDSGRGGFAFHPFDVSTDYPAIFIKKERSIRNAEIVFQSTHQKKIIASDKASYLNKVRDFIKATKTDFQKLVLSRIKVLDIEAGNLFYLFQALKNAHPSAFVYLVNIAGVGCWIGATPERLFSQNGVAETMALAGTQRDLGLPLEKVFWGQKEIEEQAIVERYFQKILEDRRVLFVKSPRRTVKAGNVLHLCTNFRFTPIQDAYSLIETLHPSPAVCGMPKQTAQQFIQANENHHRAYYCGFLGPVNMRKKTNLFVNLRCMQVLKNRFALYVGGGILPDSDPEKEWLETEMKAKTLSDVIEKVYLSEQYAF
jgi:Isochorismate synthase